MYSDKLNNYTIAVALLAVLLAGCAPGRNYRRPDLGVPVQYSAMTSVDSSLATQSWKEFFTDETLAQLIDRAVTNNFDLQLAIKRIEASKSYAKQAKAAWLPALNAQASASTNIPSENSLNGISLENFLGTSHIEDYTLATTLSWEIDIWGKIRRQKEAALASYLQSQEAARAVQTSIVEEVANSYYTLLMLDAQLRIAQRNVLLSDSTVQMMRLQKDAGLVTELAVQQGVAQLQNAQILVPQLEEAIILQENALRLLLGDWPGSVIRSATLDNLPVRDSLPAGVPADLLRLRPDVRASELALVAANARVGMAQGNMYPSLNITATGGLNAFKASNWFTMPASLFGVVSGSVAQPIFQRRMLKTQLEVAKVEREERVIEFRQSVMRAAHEVTNSLAKLDKLELQQQVATARVETLEQAVQNAQLLFRSGMADYLEVISAQSRALQAELDEAAILRQRLGARVELYKSLGGGWR
jgi:NodT family efflux transporter outer membrane factor (OMF) lipoprotein